MSVKLALIVAMCLSVRVQSSQDVMKQLSINFAKPLEVCKNEMGIPDSAIQDMSNFWREGYELKDPQIGCAIMCLASKLELLDAEYNLHHGNAMDFAKKHGADHAMAQQLVDIIHSCSQPQPDDPVDPCEKTLKSAICFKAEIHKLNWAPSADLIVAELLAES